MANGQVSAAERQRRWNDNNREMVRKSRRDWQRKNKDKVKKQKQKHREHMEDGAACEIIKQHHEDMKDDPERLTTEFMKSIVNIECDD